ncbi:hypothetical protein BKA67DRAFT_561853 [Truncatella angustata]|uniref:Rhodopsin domain-containing protein n=1 Tax=Truncatella angustata TaxID=152316 RepID=A0A9P8ZZ29_9PEZI|nr:uncharacterized protein BKA67DRAFT_561853 [Truncatella angustata]KAH6655777.1 hypothetical protein BKA67DRAFT_561853 [Truncatella angustata]
MSNTTNTTWPADGFVLPAFEYNQTEAHFLIVFGVFLTLLATISVIARLYTRYFIANHVELDDFMATMSLAATIGVCVIQSVYAAVYLPNDTSGILTTTTASKLFYANEIVYTLGVTFYKLTFLIQFWRIFRYIYYMRMVYIAAIVLITSWCVSQTLITMMTCLPIAANWDLASFDRVAGSNVICLPVWIPTYLNAGGTVLTDVIVLLLPVPALWRLNLRRSQKWAAFGVFGIGGIVPIISAGRIWSLGYPPPNGFVAQSCFNIAELAAGVITAGLATIRLLVSRHFPSRSLATLPSRTAGDSSTSKSRYLHKLSSKASSNSKFQSGHVQLSYRTSETELFDRSNNFSGAPSRWNQANFGNSATVTAGRYDQSMQAGGAEFLKEFGIIVEMNWEVTETVIEIK